MLSLLIEIMGCTLNEMFVFKVYPPVNDKIEWVFQLNEVVICKTLKWFLQFEGARFNPYLPHRFESKWLMWRTFFKMFYLDRVLSASHSLFGAIVLVNVSSKRDRFATDGLRLLSVQQDSYREMQLFFFTFWLDLIWTQQRRSKEGCPKVYFADILLKHSSRYWTNFQKRLH